MDENMDKAAAELAEHLRTMVQPQTGRQARREAPEAIKRLLEEARKHVSEEEYRELEEMANIRGRIECRVRAGRALLMSDVLRFNELAFKQLGPGQDLPQELCGLEKET